MMIQVIILFNYSYGERTHATIGSFLPFFLEYWFGRLMRAARRFLTRAWFCPGNSGPAKRGPRAASVGGPRRDSDHGPGFEDPRFR